MHQQRLTNALHETNPIAVIALYSGGYDSLVSTALTVDYWRQYAPPHPLHIASINTMLSADGWREYVSGVAEELEWGNHLIINNTTGYDEFLELVRQHGCPYSRQGHQAVFNRLKDRAIADLIRHFKQNHPRNNSNVLFVSGMRRDESPERANMPEFSRRRDTSGWFVAPIIDWSDEAVTRYRLGRGLPLNPFYETLGGSGDCYCNWGNFVTLPQLQQHAPHLHQKAALIDDISRQHHGYGYAEKPDWRTRRKLEAGEVPIFDLSNLCAGCATPKPSRAEAEATRLAWE
jgi:3'-phosphoadenosine 5'-phosphosulfate sulfotransferase (PAPS reductase)/FAD synthetase